MKPKSSPPYQILRRGKTYEQIVRTNISYQEKYESVQYPNDSRQSNDSSQSNQSTILFPKLSDANLLKSSPSINQSINQKSSNKSPRMNQLRKDLQSTPGFHDREIYNTMYLTDVGRFEITYRPRMVISIQSKDKNREALTPRIERPPLRDRSPIPFGKLKI